MELKLGDYDFFFQQTNSKTTWKMDLGGGLKYFLCSSLLGEMIQFSLIFFRWVGSTTNQKMDGWKMKLSQTGVLNCLVFFLFRTGRSLGRN